MPEVESLEVILETDYPISFLLADGGLLGPSDPNAWCIRKHSVSEQKLTFYVTQQSGTRYLPVSSGNPGTGSQKENRYFLTRA